VSNLKKLLNELEMMKITIIGIPTLNEGGLHSEISMHFGRTPYLTVIKFENDEIKDTKVIEIRGKHSGGSNTPAEIISNAGVDVLISGNLGPKAVSMLSDSGIEVFSGASGKVEDAFDAWKSGMLQLADENSCNEKTDKDSCHE
jgi:predicted Fe-Mo cluster-binding NifX family protein